METIQTDDNSPETIWAILRNVARQQEESDRRYEEFKQRQQEESARRREESDRRREESDRSLEEFKQQMKEIWRKQDERSAQLDKQLGKLGNRFGEMAEYTIVPNLVPKFAELGFEFEKAQRDTSIKDPKHGIFTEVDITLENGDKVMIVEVKTKPSTDDISYHVERMGKIRRYADLHNDKRKFLGAIAGVVINESERKYALKNGFYLIEPSGETFIITAPEGGYSPREW
jgi:hypothetical protein